MDNINIRLIPIKIDVMVGDRHYHTMTILRKRWEFLDLDDIKKEVLDRLPTLRNKKIKLAFAS